MARERLRRDVKARAELAAEDRVIEALCGANASEETKLRFRHKLRDGELNDREIEIEVAEGVRVRQMRSMLADVRAKGEPVKEEGAAG